LAWRLRLFSFGGYALALAALALEVFGAYDSNSTGSTPSALLHRRNTGSLLKKDPSMYVLIGCKQSDRFAMQSERVV